MYYPHSYTLLISLLRSRPQAHCRLRGGFQNPKIQGEVLFYQTKYGVFVVADVMGLPTSEASCAENIFAFHIHSGNECTLKGETPFITAGGHYNPDGCSHPNHRGDLPPLFEARGRAFFACLTDRFRCEEIIGRTLIIHEGKDDFTTDPSGNAGDRIACGVIVGS